MSEVMGSNEESYFESARTPGRVVMATDTVREYGNTFVYLVCVKHPNSKLIGHQSRVRMSTLNEQYRKVGSRNGASDD